MLAGQRHHTRARRGIVLVLVLAMLGLLALIGVTFATFSGQSRINARLFAQSVIRPQDDELMDFALQQLITDTPDVRSVIHGHSLARDMYGNDAFNNGYLTANPATGGSLLISNAAPSKNVAGAFEVETNIPVPATSPAMYGYDFTRWVMRVSYTGTVSPGSPQPVSQTCEVLIDDYLPGQTNTQFSGKGYHAFLISPIDRPLPPNTQTILNNPTMGYITSNANTTPFPGWPAKAANGATMALTGAYNALASGNTTALNYVAFTLDGRWLYAFNGPGLSTQPPFTPTYGANYGNVSLSVPPSTYGNFRYHGMHPNSVGMDEDYDACDLENWFLALQSADGQVMIPSFHRPGIVRYQDPSTPLDWDRSSGGFRYPNGTNAAPNADSAARILRPVAADGHDALTFPDLTPDPTTGKITYDVDNDGDGVTDSVWLDLGYPARRDANGVMYKPLFAFMVIGLNGRIPLNTAGNLANTSGGAGPYHASHLGNSVSEINPTFVLQNAYVPLIPGLSPNGDYDPFNAAGTGSWPPQGTFNTQVDNSTDNAVNGHAAGGLDVRLTQLRNLLAGTRPQPGTSPFSVNTNLNGDANQVVGSWPGTTAGAALFMPNGIVDGADAAAYNDGNGNPLVARLTQPRAGRWGEASSIPGVPFSNTTGAGPAWLNLVQQNYDNPVRAGYSYDVADFLTNATYTNTPFPRDAADDNYNAFDIYPIHNPTATGRAGEVYDLDYYDAAGALLLPVERMRRFVTPTDINGTGSVQAWGGTTGNGPGPDPYGRVQFNSYFRPAGVAGAINVTSNPSSTYPYGSIAPHVLQNGSQPGFGSWDPTTGVITPWTLGKHYEPDVTNNPLHGYEQYKLPNQNQAAGIGAIAAGGRPQQMGGMPIDLPNNAQYPTTFPTYDVRVNSKLRLDGVNDADEMNLYSPNPLLDSPYGPSDLEWLYRQQDVDGASLTSRLAYLAPVSFTNTIDGQRRRRLVSLDSWESNSFVWANDNPGGAFANNAWFSGGPTGANPTQTLANPAYPSNQPPVPINIANAGLASQSAIQTAISGTVTNIPTPSLAHRNRKINLNYPLPVSNDPNEPVRQKWIDDTYHLLKAILPPTSVDSAEELAQLSQFVINIIDFRDPDATMTHWQNPDVYYTPSAAATAYPTLSLKLVNAHSVPLDQYGMEYNPVAINEVLAYGFQSRKDPTVGSAVYTNRLFVELVNTLTAAYNPTFDTANNDATKTTISLNNYYGYGPIPGAQSTSNYPTGGNIPGATPPYQASTLDLGGFSYTPNDPYGGGCWDLFFTLDNTMSRPDPYCGELVYNPIASINYKLVPLNREAVTSTSGGAGVTNPAAQNGGDVTLLPLPPNATNPATNHPLTLPSTNPPTMTPAPTIPPPPITYFYVVGSANSANEVNPITSASGSPYPCVTQYFTSGYDPLNAGSAMPFIAANNWKAGILQGWKSNVPPTNYQAKLPSYAAPTGATPTTAQYFWVCLRRPANPFAPVSATNPMCVVDSMRFPYIDGTANPGVTWKTLPNSTTLTVDGTPNTVYSAQRLQPYRGGHAVPMPNAVPSGANAQGAFTTPIPPDPRYGYTEQIAVPQTYTRSGGGKGGTFGLANNGGASNGPASTNYFYHTLGYINDSAENWDYFPFNDRDFSSVAELLLVPGCPPGLFTKQFGEVAPSQVTAANIFFAVTPTLTPTSTVGPGLTSQNGTVASIAGPLPANSYPITATATASVPFLAVSNAVATSSVGNSQTQGTTVPNTVPTITWAPTYLTQPMGGAVKTPLQPHAFPYLVDRFFYTGASTFYYPPTGGALDPGSPTNGTRRPVVGGPGGDGWFKMLEFFEVPSQNTGAIGPVALGTNFDWARQDTKPGLMNLNLVIDEEAFYGIFSSQGSPSSGYGENLLNSIELPLLAVNQNGQLALPYTMPLVNNTNLGANPAGSPPIPQGAPPVPMVVSGIQLTGAPNFVYPLTDQTQFSQHGFLAGTDPIQQAINTAGGGGAQPAPGNRIKAAFAQFLWARHGGSGYMFGFGNGNSGENSAIFTPGLPNYSQRVPAERPFRSLSFPDINYTIMRPASLPPSATVGSNPAMLNANFAQNAALFYALQTVTAGKFYHLAQNFYSPFVHNNNLTGFPNKTLNVYTGDPGVRNPFLNQGYATGDPSYTIPPYSVYPTVTTNTVPAGAPIPSNVALPQGGTTLAAGIAMPPPIPAARLFQPPDAFGAGQMQIMGYTGIYVDGTGNIPPAVSNASDSGDPWINNLVANQTLTLPALTHASYTLNNGFSTLVWPSSSGTQVGGAYYASGSSPMVPPTGVLPPVSINYPPHGISGNLTKPTNLTLNNSYGVNSQGKANNATSNLTFLGANSVSGTDDRQHPYWRTEMLQKAMNLTTVRTHQYAVWITVGFFEVKRQGDIAMLAQGLPQLAFDIMGPEIGALNGQNIRYRGFFLVDRLRLTGFNPNDVGAFHNAVVYRKLLQ